MTGWDVGGQLNWVCGISRSNEYTKVKKKARSKKEFQTFNIQIRELEQIGFISQIEDKIFLTEKGMLFADSISEQLFLI